MTSRTTVLSDREALKFHQLLSSEDDNGTTSEDNSDVDEREYAQFLKIYKPLPISIKPEKLIVIRSPQTKKPTNTNYVHAIKNNDPKRRIRKFYEEINSKKENKAPIVTVPTNNRYKKLEVTSDEYESASSSEEEMYNHDNNIHIRTFSQWKNNNSINPYWVSELSDIGSWAEDVHVVSSQKKTRKRRRSNKKRKSQSLQHGSCQEKKYSQCFEPLTKIPVKMGYNYEAPNMTPHEVLKLRIEEITKNGRESQSLQQGSCQEKKYYRESGNLEPLTKIPVETRNNYEAHNMTPHELFKLEIEKITKNRTNRIERTNRRNSQSLQHDSYQEKKNSRESGLENKYSQHLDPLTKIPVEMGNNYEAPKMTPHEELKLSIEEITKTKTKYWFDQVGFVDDYQEPGSDLISYGSPYYYENFNLQTMCNLCSECPYPFNPEYVDTEEENFEKVIMEYSLLPSHHIPYNSYIILNDTSNARRFSFIKGTFNKCKVASTNFIKGLDNKEVLLVFGVLLGSYMAIKTFK